MDDRELESNLRQTLAAGSDPSERVWAKVRRKPEPRWAPTFAETAFSVLAGVLALALLAKTQMEETPRSVAQAEPSIERTFAASLHTVNHLP